MILPLLKTLVEKRIILASGSPRRKDILESMGLKIEVFPSTFEENLEVSMFPSVKEFVIETALQKALEVAERISKSGQIFELIIAADTIVTYNGKIFGKPKEDNNAAEMLNELNGKSHKVLTGVTLLWNGYRSEQTSDESNIFIDKFCETTKVRMASLTEDIISSYVETKEPRDKAGGYGIQGLGGSLIEGIEGDYYNVVGFPLHRFCQMAYRHYITPGKP